MIKDSIDFAAFANPWSRKFYSQNRESMDSHLLAEFMNGSEYRLKN